jgi:uncharacterized RDD family membrane protein YckC
MTESTQELASRWQRLWGALLDGFIAMAIVLPVMWISGIWQQLMRGGQLSVEQRIGLFIFGVILFFVLQGYLLAKHGQTIGKRIVGTRIVSAEDGQIFPLSRIFWLRNLPASLVGQIPTVGQLLVVIDVLFIFRKDKRCIHDLIAGTKVVKLEQQNSGASLVGADSSPVTGKITSGNAGVKTGKPSVGGSSATINDDSFYDEVAKELEANKLIPGVWTRAFAEADGDENRAKAIYIKLRVLQKRAAMPLGGDTKAVSWEVVNERWVRNIYANGDVTMSDKDTCRMWLFNANPCGKKNWSDAMAYCGNLTYAGYSDWRLPDKDTLEAQFKQKGSFFGVQGDCYWSGTSYANDTGYAWGANMSDGCVGHHYKKAYNGDYVWPVRGGQ